MIITASILGSALLFAGCQTPQAQKETEMKQETERTDAGTLPDTEEAGNEEQNSGLVFSAVDMDGNEIDEGIFQEAGITMLNVWATYCEPCIREMPDLGALAAEYDGKVQIVGIVVDVLDSQYQIDDGLVEVARSIVEETNAAYLHLLPSEDLISTVLRNVSVVPTTYFVDSQGHPVGKTQMGSKSKEKWAELFDQALEEVEKQ